VATTEARVAGCRAHSRHPQTLNGELKLNLLEVGFVRSKAAQLGRLGERVVLSKDHPGWPALSKGRPEGVVSVRMGDWIVGWR